MHTLEVDICILKICLEVIICRAINITQATAGPSHTQATGPSHHHANSGPFHTQATAGPSHT